MDERLGEKDKEFIYTTLSYEYVFLLWKASSRQPGGDPSRCITWLPVPLEKVKVRGLVISFPVSPPGGSTSQRLFRHFLSTLPRFFFSPVFLRLFLLGRRWQATPLAILSSRQPPQGKINRLFRTDIRFEMSRFEFIRIIS